MREIKFRGKELEANKWVYGYLLGNASKTDKFVYIAPFDITPQLEIRHTIMQGGYPNFDEKDYSHCWKKRECANISVIRVAQKTIGQYTGLKDKNGIELYESDIVYVASEDENATIEWDNETARFILSFDDWFADFDNYYGEDLEVIGNIYDNPDLIKE